MELKNKYNKQLQDLEQLYSDESLTQRQNISLKEEKIEIQKQLIISQQELSDTQIIFFEYRITYDVNFINGDWNANFVFGDNNEANFLELKNSKGIPYTSKFRIIMGNFLL